MWRGGRGQLKATVAATVEFRPTAVCGVVLQRPQHQLDPSHPLRHTHVETMRISRISLVNWKNFADVDVEIPQRVFLVGPNASGKSNFLDAIRFLRDIARSGGSLDTALKARGGFSKIRNLGARRRNEVVITVDLVDESTGALWHYSLALEQQSRGLHQTVVAHELVRRNDERILERPGDDDKADVLLRTQTHLEQIAKNGQFRDIANFFAGCTYVHLIPQLIRRPEYFFNPSVNPDEDEFGFHFIERIKQTPETTRNARLKKIEKALQVAVPQLKDLTISTDEITGVPHLEATYEHWRPNAGRQRESQFSDGTIRLVGLLWSILEARELLLLEEPEISLHYSIVGRLPALMYRMNQTRKGRRIQTIVSTHSADLLAGDGITGDEILMFLPSQEKTEVRCAANIPDVEKLLEGGLAPYEVVLDRTAPPHVQEFDFID